MQRQDNFTLSVIILKSLASRKAGRLALPLLGRLPLIPAHMYE